MGGLLRVLPPGQQAGEKNFYNQCGMPTEPSLDDLVTTLTDSTRFAEYCQFHGIQSHTSAEGEGMKHYQNILHQIAKGGWKALASSSIQKLQQCRYLLSHWKKSASEPAQACFHALPSIY